MFCLSLFPYSILSQELEYRDFVYTDYIKSVKLTHSGLRTSIPVIDLQKRGRLKLVFDDMEGGFKNYTYEIIHCDKDWAPSDLDEFEYIDGFNGEEIDEYAASVCGYSDYTNYQVTLPNDDINWTISGNYLLVIYDDDLGIPVISRRFMVVENLVTIGYEVKRASNVQKLKTHQEIKLSINHRNFNISRPGEEVYTTVLQNGNWNSAMTNLSADYAIGDELFIDQYDKLVFPALKEFRNFDIRSLNYATEFIHSIDLQRDGADVLLKLNRKRSLTNFLSETDANGFYIIDNADYPDAHVSSEYVNVIFNLQSNREYDEDIYMIGAFSDWQAREDYKLEYDALRSLYIGSALFKQGYYDYMFALESDGYLDMLSLEGSWYETENDYLVLIYYREFGARFDRLIGVSGFNSNLR